MKHPIQLICNDQNIETSVSPGTTVLDFLRDHLFLRGTKAACREGDCGSCTVLVGELTGSGNKGRSGVAYKAVTSCLLPLGDMEGKHLVSIEGINPPMETTVSDIPLTPVQQAFVDQGATQCGFCTPGFIMSLTGFFLEGAPLTVEKGLEAVSGNICRCTGYASIKRCIDRLIDEYGAKLSNTENLLETLTVEGFIPLYFTGIPPRLKTLGDSIDKNRALPAARLIAGGTDLYVQQPDALPGESVGFASRESGLAGISIFEDRCRIGAGTTMEQIKSNGGLLNIIPCLAEAGNLVASRQIRQRATLGGNIVNASPIGDFSGFFLALDARLGLMKKTDTKTGGAVRTVLMKDFYLGYKTLDLKEDELVAFVEFDRPGEKSAVNFEKVSRRTRLDIASVNSTMLIETDGGEKDAVITKAGLSAGGVAPIPLFLETTAAFLTGKPLTVETVRQAADMLQEEISPISDVRGTAEYKRLLLRQLFFTHFIRLFPDIFGEGGLL